jgi:uncharacterized protein
MIDPSFESFLTEMRQSNNNFTNSYPTKEEAIQIMKKLGLATNIINHELAVMRRARDISHNITKLDVNIELVKIGAIFHDIGRIKSHGMDHGPIGGKMLRILGISENIALITERHTMAGITVEEAKQFDLPLQSYLPESIEEKIVCLADKYFMGTKNVSIEQRFQRWIDKYGKTTFLRNHLQRAKDLEEEILALIY